MKLNAKRKWSVVHLRLKQTLNTNNKLLHNFTSSKFYGNLDNEEKLQLLLKVEIVIKLIAHYSYGQPS